MKWQGWGPGLSWKLQVEGGSWTSAGDWWRRGRAPFWQESLQHRSSALEQSAKRPQESQWELFLQYWKEKRTLLSALTLKKVSGSLEHLSVTSHVWIKNTDFKSLLGASYQRERNFDPQRHHTKASWWCFFVFLCLNACIWREMYGNGVWIP